MANSQNHTFDWDSEGSRDISEIVPPRREVNSDKCLVADSNICKTVDRNPSQMPKMRWLKNYFSNYTYFFEQGYFFLLTFKDKYVLGCTLETEHDVRATEP
jgi:hypothetical protein